MGICFNFQILGRDDLKYLKHKMKSKKLTKQAKYLSRMHPKDDSQHHAEDINTQTWYLIRHSTIYKGNHTRNKSECFYSPFTEAGTARAAAAWILILKLEESRSSSRRILKTDGALSDKHVYVHICCCKCNMNHKEIICSLDGWGVVSRGGVSQITFILKHNYISTQMHIKYSRDARNKVQITLPIHILQS